MLAGAGCERVGKALKAGRVRANVASAAFRNHFEGGAKLVVGREHEAERGVGEAAGGGKRHRAKPSMLGRGGIALRRERKLGRGVLD